jgi:hypothetical protein
MDPKIRAAMEAEAERMAKKAIDEMNRANEDEIDAMILYILRTEFGFGAKRLRRFYDRFTDGLKELGERYLMNEYDDRLWLCQRKLKESGIDISKWKGEKKGECKDECKDKCIEQN